MALFTLDRMVAGGIYDQLGGGFHRYSTDFEWRVPHFEKMLYDQALIARACLYAWRRTGDTQYADTAREVLDFTLKEMHAAGGRVLFSAQCRQPGAGQRDRAYGRGCVLHLELAAVDRSH